MIFTEAFRILTDDMYSACSQSGDITLRVLNLDYPVLSFFNGIYTGNTFLSFAEIKMMKTVAVLMLGVVVCASAFQPVYKPLVKGNGFDLLVLACELTNAENSNGNLVWPSKAIRFLAISKQHLAKLCQLENFGEKKKKKKEKIVFSTNLEIVFLRTNACIY